MNIKVLLYGSNFSGKTALVHRALHGFYRDPMSTIGAEFNAKIFKSDSSDECYSLGIWTMPGVELYLSIRKIYFQNTAAIMVVYDVTDERSLSIARKDLIEALEMSDPDVYVILAGNKCDLVNSRKISKAEGEALASEFCIEHIEVSALNGTNVDEAFQLLAKGAYKVAEVRSAKQLKDRAARLENEASDIIDDIKISTAAKLKGFFSPLGNIFGSNNKKIPSKENPDCHSDFLPRKQEIKDEPNKKTYCMENQLQDGNNEKNENVIFSEEETNPKLSSSGFQIECAEGLDTFAIEYLSEKKIKKELLVEIESNHNLNDFYRTICVIFSCYINSASAAAGGLVSINNESYETAEKIANIGLKAAVGITATAISAAVSVALPVALPLASLTIAMADSVIDEVINASTKGITLFGKERLLNIAKELSRVVTRKDFEKIITKVALRLTISYRDQLIILSRDSNKKNGKINEAVSGLKKSLLHCHDASHAENVAEYLASLLIENLQGLTNCHDVQLIEDQLVNHILNFDVSAHGFWEQMSELKRTIINTIGMHKIETIHGKSYSYHDFFTKPGIRDSRGTCYSGNGTDPAEFGYYLATEENAKAKGLSESSDVYPLAPSDTSEWKTRAQTPSKAIEVTISNDVAISDSKSEVTLCKQSSLSTEGVLDRLKIIEERYAQLAKENGILRKTVMEMRNASDAAGSFDVQSNNGLVYSRIKHQQAPLRPLSIEPAEVERISNREIMVRLSAIENVVTPLNEDWLIKKRKEAALMVISKSKSVVSKNITKKEGKDNFESWVTTTDCEGVLIRLFNRGHFSSHTENENDVNFTIDSLADCLAFFYINHGGHKGRSCVPFFGTHAKVESNQLNILKSELNQAVNLCFDNLTAKKNVACKKNNATYQSN